MNHKMAELPSALRVSSQANSRPTGNIVIVHAPMKPMSTNSAAVLFGLTRQANGNHVSVCFASQKYGLFRARTCPNEPKPCESGAGHEHFARDCQVMSKHSIKEWGRDDRRDDACKEEHRAHQTGSGVVVPVWTLDEI
jgi:hypothetical protein